MTPEEIQRRFPNGPMRQPGAVTRFLTDPMVSRGIQIGLVLLNVAIGSLCVEIARGTVPIPPSWLWTVPIILPVLNAVTYFLPRIGSEEIAQQVNALKAAGVPRSQMVVLSHDEAASALADKGAR